VWIAAAAVAGVLVIAGILYLRPAGIPAATPASDTTPGKAGREPSPAGQPAKAPALGEKSAPSGEATVTRPAGAGAVSPASSEKEAHPRSDEKFPAGEGAKSPETAEKIESPPDNGADPPPNLPVDIEPKVISRAEPEYPDVQKRGGVTGDVRLLVLVDREGKVQKVRVESYDAEAFINPAVEAARQCVFSPAIMNKAKVRAWAPLKIRFGARQDDGQ